LDAEVFVRALIILTYTEVEEEILAFENPKRKEHPSILIVEDSATQALRLRILLEESGYDVVVANNGAAAVTCMDEWVPDLVISDIVMPELDGYELCKKIKADDALKDVPVLLLTQLSEPEDIVKGLESGADNFVTKPYDPNLLLSRIQYILVNNTIRTHPRTDMGIEVFFAGKRHYINSDRIQILDLLFSTYEISLRQKRELERVNKELKEALDTIDTLHGILPICSHCKKIRNDGGAWTRIEEYIGKHADVQFSHGICPDCLRKHYPEMAGKDRE
jgi:two-component system, OmpR family, response regulator VanR